MTLRPAVCVAIALLTASAAHAQVRRPTPKLLTDVVSDRVRAGAPAHVRLKVVHPSGFHVQSDKPRDPALIATALTLTPPVGISVVRTTYPKSTDLAQPGRGEPLAVFSGTFVIDVEIALARSVSPGTIDIPGELRYQSCTDQICFPPARDAVRWRLTVNPPRAR